MYKLYNTTLPCFLTGWSLNSCKHRTGLPKNKSLAPGPVFWDIAWPHHRERQPPFFRDTLSALCFPVFWFMNEYGKASLHMWCSHQNQALFYPVDSNPLSNSVTEILGAEMSGVLPVMVGTEWGGDWVLTDTSGHHGFILQSGGMVSSLRQDGGQHYGNYSA